MKVLIAGAGEVGTYLAKLLSREMIDTVLLDKNAEVLNNLDDNFDLMTIVGSPTSINSLKEAGVGDTDLFVAVTPEESQNIMSCMLSSELGAKKTLARIDNYEYLLPETSAFFEKSGVHSLIYPEMLAADEVVYALKRPWMRQWHELYGGRLILTGIKVRENASILNIPLYELTKDDSFYHIVGIKRYSSTIIPGGSDVIKKNDIVFFTTTPDYLPKLRRICGKEEFEVKNVMIMGGGRIVVRTCLGMPSQVNVKIIEQNIDRCHWLTQQVNNAMIIHGDGRDTELLKEEGIRDMDAFVALTANSEANILACMAAKRFGVKKTVAEVENIDYITLVEKLDIGTVINKKLIAAGHIYKLLLDADVSNIKTMTVANADVAELIAKEDSKITKRAVKNLGLPKDLTIGGLVRDGKACIVTGDTHIQAGDHVIIFCHDTAIRKIEKYFH
ncbi:MAG: Trk system potassium transporter TrkA [Candidatus Azobacteroides sp.]|nr:Trk system potassium transporter TrkA [Candidatus Azobacteroides sp.]